MPRGPAPEPVLSEVVRQRLAALLDEVPARRAIVLPEPEDETAPGDPVSAPPTPRCPPHIPPSPTVNPGRIIAGPRRHPREGGDLKR